MMCAFGDRLIAVEGGAVRNWNSRLFSKAVYIVTTTAD